MTQEQFNAVIKMLSISTGAEGLQLPADQTLSVYASRAAASLNVTKVEKLKLEGELLYLRNHRGEQYVLLLEDIFAVALDPPSASSRKAGFASD